MTLIDNLKIEFVSEKDDSELRKLLKDNPMPGGVSLSLEREPNFYWGSAVEGDTHDIVAGREVDTGQLVGLGARSLRNMWFNGKVQRFGYLSQLRLNMSYRGKKHLISCAFQKLGELYHKEDIPYYITTIIADNKRARKLLEEERPGFPSYIPVGLYCVQVLPVWKKVKNKVVSGYEISKADKSDLEGIVECLNRNYENFQFAPHWTVDDLLSGERTRDLSISDFWVAKKDNKVCGCMALWDQTGFKQTVVHSYSGMWQYSRWLINMLAPFIGVPKLPKPGNQFHHAYISHIAVDNNNNELFMGLLTQLINEANKRNYAYVTFGLESRDSFLAAIKEKFKTMEYKSIIYLVQWSNPHPGEKMDNRIPFLDAATL